MIPIRRLATLSSLCLSSFALAAALFGQQSLGAMPCAWCILQRIAYLFVGLASLFCLLADIFLPRSAAKIVAFFGVFSSAFGLWSAYNQVQSVRGGSDCGISLANNLLMDWNLDQFSAVFFQPKANCSDASFPILGVPMEYFSIFGLFFCFTFLFFFIAKLYFSHPFRCFFLLSPSIFLSNMKSSIRF